MSKEKILSGKTYLGIELVSTRIKAVLTDDEFHCIAIGSYDWENKLENGYWTYSLDEIHKGVKGCFSSLVSDVAEKYSIEFNCVAAMNFRAINLNPDVENMQQELLDKHYLRKHGKNAYYGQKN